MSAWCAVQPDVEDWRAWLSSMPLVSKEETWPSLLFAALDQDKELWQNFLTAAAQHPLYEKNAMNLLETMRTKSIDTGKELSPLPLGCLEAMVEMTSLATPHWKQQMLMRSPQYWFGNPNDIDPASTQPLHELGVALLRGCDIPAKRLPNLAWSPSSVYDDYGQYPETVKPYVAPIQHALEYAVFMHQSQPSGPDPLAHAEVYGYFERCSLSLSAFETLVDLSQATPTFSSYVRVLHSMLSPEPEQYHVDLSDDAPQP